MTHRFLPRRALAFAAAASAAALLGACASYEPLKPSATAAGDVRLGDIAMPAGARADWPQDRWWTAFGDRQLDQLIDRALQQSPNLAAAQARIARAQAASGLARSATGVQVNGAVDLSYGRQSEHYMVPKPPLGKGGEYITTGRTAVDFGYDLDFWGQHAAQIRAAESQVKAAAFDRDAARLALTTSIARAYAQLASQYQLLEILQATQKQRGDIRTLTAQRVKGGLDTNVELRQTESSEAALESEIVQLGTAIDVTRLQLAALAGDMPEAAKAIQRPALAPAAFAVPSDLPIGLLARRPELAAQRARIEAALGDEDAARAQFYPSVNLAGFVGFQAIGLGQLFNGGSLINGVGPVLRLPIFDAGRLRANYAAKHADIDLAITQYNQSVVSAAQDVAEQLTRAASLAREEEAVRRALAGAEEAYRLAMLRYRAGLTPYLSVLSVETQQLAQRRALADLQARRNDLQIGLVRALGGGFRDPAAQDGTKTAFATSTPNSTAAR